MKSVTFNSVPAYLLDDAPDWTQAVELRVEALAYMERGLTQIEARRPLSESLRCKLEYRAVLADGALVAMRNALQDLNTQPVLCPLWPAEFAAGTTPACATDYYYVPGDPAGPVRPSSALPFTRTAYPLLIGRFAMRPTPQLLHGEAARVMIRWEEDDAVSTGIAPGAFTTPGGLPDASSEVRPLFPFAPNWNVEPGAGGSEIELESQEIGQGRAIPKAFYAQPAKRIVEQVFLLADDQPWQFLRFFKDELVSPFWVPSGLSEVRLTADVESQDNALTVDDPASLGGNAYVVLDDLLERVPLHVTGTSGNDLTLEQAVGTAFSKELTRVESLMLGTFDQRAAVLAFMRPGVCTVELRFHESPWEVAGASGEVAGDTMGALNVTAFLYVFSVAYPGATQYWRFTNYERSLTYAANPYLSKPIDHGSLLEYLGLDRVALSLRARHFTGNPLSLMVPFTLEWPLVLDIYECTVASESVANVNRLFHGEVDSAEFDGPFIRAQAKSLSSLFDRKLPRRLLQPSCNWSLFETGCAIDREFWKWTGVVVSYSAATCELVLSGVARTIAPAIEGSAHYFAGGYLYFGAGTGVQYRMIGDSTAESANELTLVLATPFTVAPAVGATVTFHPGCDGNYSTCKDRFSNGARFGGFPFMPPGNPSGAKVEGEPTSGGKK